MPEEVSVVERINTPTRIVIFLLIAIALIALMAFAIINSDNRPSSTVDQNSTRQDIVTLSPHTLVYGSWSGNQSVITAYDLSTGREGIIAALPLNIKKVSVTSPDTLLFISGISGAQDHGREITQYNLTARTSQVIYRSSEGFGIDDYVLSPDSKNIAVWEVQLDEESGTLSNGKSRVFTAKVGESTKNTIYDESVNETSPVRYPRAILNDGTVFMDRFLPNSGAGWAYGMSISNFTGSQKEDLATLQNGTYGTQPLLSPDGKYLVFAGYDGSQGNGAMLVDGYRRALVSPNTVELLDTTTRERIKQPNFTNNRIYPIVTWNSADDIQIVSQASTDADTGTFNYNIQSKTLTKSNLPEVDEDMYVTQELSATAWLLGKQDLSSSTIGNLGQTYEAPYTTFAIYNPQDKQVTPLNTSVELKQLIAVLPATSFGSFITIVNNSQPTEEQLQLKTFSIKSELAPTRGVQQTDNEKTCVMNPTTNTCPRCRDLAATQCQQNQSYGTCFINTIISSRNSGTCYDSPLYLYGDENLSVDVQIHTPVSETNPQQNGKFTATLKKNALMEIGGKSYDSIDFNYTSALRKITPPTTGTVISRAELPKLISSYSQKLSLNEKEEKDLQQYAQSVVYGKYVFVSFFDHEMSHAILPITFNPKPDVYRNIVFYFKNFEEKPPFSVETPKFESIQRHGFTAVEISGIVE